MTKIQDKNTGQQRSHIMKIVTVSAVVLYLV